MAGCELAPYPPPLLLLLDDCRRGGGAGGDDDDDWSRNPIMRNKICHRLRGKDPGPGPGVRRARAVDWPVAIFSDGLSSPSSSPSVRLDTTWENESVACTGIAREVSPFPFA